ncbi:MAG TPA: Sec-independent protein translocase subunit TatA [Actinomycetospora sp.]|nr:Sec-independent protein translocase subunit TatA [Actinomycetospora sp.]
MSEWVIIAIVGVVLLFSAKKLPDMARGLGQSLRVFKAETRGLKEDEQAAKPGEASAEPQAPGRALNDGSSGTNGAAPSSPDAAPTTRPGSTSS